MAEVQEEIDKYRDFLVIDMKDEYFSLPWKTLEFFKAAFQHFEADYYVKADDDIYLRTDRLATLLAKEGTRSQTYMGCMKKGPVITDPKMKWYEKSGHLIGNEYFLHAYGPIYILSAEVVASLATSRNNSLRMFSNEDVTIGSWMLAMNVHHENNRALCDPRCTPTSIAVWEIPKCSGLCNPSLRMKERHAMRMCSKSPTLPTDDRELWHSAHTTSHQDASYAGRSAGLVCNILLLLVFMNPKKQERSFEGTYGLLVLAVSCVHRLLLYKKLLLLSIFPS